MLDAQSKIKIAKQMLVDSKTIVKIEGSNPNVNPISRVAFHFYVKMKFPNILCAKYIKSTYQCAVRVVFISSLKAGNTWWRISFIHSLHPAQLDYLVAGVSEKGDCLQITKSSCSGHSLSASDSRFLAPPMIWSTEADDLDLCSQLERPVASHMAGKHQCLEPHSLM